MPKAQLVGPEPPMAGNSRLWIVIAAVATVFGVLLVSAALAVFVGIRYIRQEVVANSETVEQPSTDGRDIGRIIRPAESPEPVEPAAPSVTVESPEVRETSTQQPATGRETESTDTDDRRLLKYAWQVDVTYNCHYQLEATLGDQKLRATGMTAYTPTDVDADAVGGEQPTDGEGSGTAFAVHPNGVLATCAHVILGATEIKVHLGQETYDARVIDFDTDRDVALLKIDAKAIPCVTLTDSDGVELAQDIRAIGYPLSDVLGESVKISRGTICGVVTRRDGKLFQIDASVNPGNSGGPLVDSSGQVVGIASALLSGESIDSVGFAVPANDMVALLKENDIRVESQAAGADLSGPELARRVTPAVALLKVRLGAKGVGMAQQRIVRYIAVAGTPSVSRSVGRYGGYPSPLRGGTKTESGIISVDDFGNVSHHKGELAIPLLLDPAGTIGIEKLPGDGRETWKSFRKLALALLDKEPAPSRGYPFEDIPRLSPYRSRFDRYPHSRYRPRRPWEREPSTPTKVTFLPAVEEIHYRLGPTSADGTVQITKEYHLRTLDKDNGKQSLEIESKGTILWNASLGVPGTSELEGTLRAGDENLTIRVPFQLKYRFEKKGTADTVADAGKPPKELVRKLADPSSEKPSPTKLDEAPSSGGLSLFNPDDEPEIAPKD